MPQKLLGSQTDFSFGEVDPDLKRADGHPARKAGLRQASNVRIHNSGTLQNRSGRSALYPNLNAVRIEEFTISPGNDFKLNFGAGSIGIFNSVGVLVGGFSTQGSGAALPWTALNTNLIVYAILGFQIFLTFPGMRPQVITLTGAIWTIAAYNELNIGTQKRTPFYRLSVQGNTILPGAQTGVTTLVSTQNLFVPAMVGTRMRFVDRQMLITAVADLTHATVLIEEPLPGAQDITLSVDPTAIFNIGDVVIGATSGSKGIVTATNSATSHMAIQLISLNTSQVTVADFTRFGLGATVTVAFIQTETISGPGGSATATVAGAITAPTFAVAFYDEEVMNDFRGYPASCFVDQFRLGFCDFPSVPGGQSWSAVNSPNDLYVGFNPNDGMFEIAPHKVRIFHTIPGPEGSEFVICDKRVYYIPISETNPLKPGSVAFKTLTGDGCAQVQPRIAQEAILYVNAGKSSVMSIIATGAYQRPFDIKGLTNFHAHLFNNIQAIACPSADGTFNERYAYVLNGDGSIVVGKYKSHSLATEEPVIGWGPWSGAGTVKWIAAWQQDVLFTTSYFGTTICEILNDAVYMDASLFVNALPSAFTPPPGSGPLWWIPNQSVALMDQGTRYMGIYQIDATGHIIPQGKGGENLLAATLVAGQIWSGVIEPFTPSAQPGSDAQQRLHKRQITEFAAWVIHSTGFMIAKLFSARQTPTSPLPGAITTFREYPAYNQGEDTTLPPFQRETVEFYQPSGSEFDPRTAVIWSTPGPLQILEIAIEVGS